ncbi:MAG: ATP-binding cassette domain-containing protein [Proteobacteria bacterium]|nr:MAG: ATP-binding cassette domain-containing protein [Pseudomonadota bacterium]
MDTSLKTAYALEVRHVSKNFGSQRALHDVSLRVKAGETHVLLGLSGSGKSTLVRLLVGLTRPDAGEILVAGGDKPGAIGYVPQEGGLFPHLTAARNITLVAGLRGMGRGTMRKRLDELSNLMKLDPALLRRYPKELSGGQRQRVALMRAAFLEPALLVLDEPLGALDPLVRLEVQDELKTIFAKLGTSAVMVTHDIDEARFFADEVSLLKAGSVVQTGSFETLHDAPASEFVHQFFHSRRTWTGP